MTSRTPAPPRTAAGARRAVREDWLDLARGLAVVSMIVAHTSPWGGLWNLSEYLTAPLFAFLVGASLVLAWTRSDRRYGFFVIANLLRGLVLVALGEALQALYFPIIVVLQTLGVLTIVLAPLVPLLVRWSWSAYAVALAAAILSPLAMAQARLWLSADRHPDFLEWLVGVLAAGDAYRVTSFLALGAAGGAAVRLLRPSPDPGPRGDCPALLPAVLLLLGAVTAYTLGRATVGADPYSGTTPEIIGAILLSAAVTAGCRWLLIAMGPGRSRWLDPLVATGRMALSAYALQILALAALVQAGVIEGDDHWAVMSGVAALCVVFSWGWLRLAPVGPLELLVRTPARALASAWPARRAP